MLTLIFWFFVIAAFATPIVVATFLARRYQMSNVQTVSCLVIGAVGWGLIAKLPKAVVVIPILAIKHLSPSDADLSMFLRSDTGYLLVFAATAGIFEELCKPLGLLIMRKQVSHRNAAAMGWIVGAGAGLLESIVFVMQALASPSPGGGFDMTVGLERMLTTFFHAGTSAFLVAFVRDRRFVLGLSVPILLHTALDFVGTYAALHQFDKWLGLVIIGLFSFIATMLAVLATRRDNLFRKEPPSESP